MVKVVLSVSEDVSSPRFLVEGAQTPGRLPGGSVVGRFVACSAFIEAVARHGSLDYVVSPSQVGDEATWRELAEALPLPLVRPLEVPELLARERVVLHELARHRLTRLALLRKLYASHPGPVTAQLHGMGSDGLVEELCLMLLAPLVAEDTIFCPSKAAECALTTAIDDAQVVLAQRGADVTRPRIARVPLGVDTDYFRPMDKVGARVRLGLEPKEFVFASLGRLSPSDKVDLLPLLRTFARLVSRVGSDRPVRLVIAGDDRNDRSREYVHTLRRSIHAFGLDAQVTLLCRFDPDDRLAVFNAADVFVALSDSPGESFGLTVVEALCCGAPVIAADWDGYRDHIRTGVNGFLVPVLWSDRLDYLDRLLLLASRLESDLAAAQSVAIDLESLLAVFVRCVSATDGSLRAMARACLGAREVYTWRSLVRSYEARWTELMRCPTDVAAGVRALPLTRRDRVFRSYPSTLLSEDLCLERGDIGDPRGDAAGAPHVYRHLGGAGFDPPLVESLLERVRLEAVRAGDLIRSVTPSDRSRAVWHLMWLLKHGCVKITQPTCSPYACPGGLCATRGEGRDTA